MLIRCLFLFWISASFHVSVAQSSERANIWYFGRHAGLNFNTSPPTPISNATLDTWEGCAVICDERGQIVLYTDGSKVWNKAHQEIQNATNLGGNSSSTQSAIIIPKPRSTNTYFIVSVDYGKSSGRIQYCELTINDAGGLGRVISKNIPLLSHASEKLTAVPHCNGKDYWVIAHERGNNKFYAWLLTAIGIDKHNPVVSAIGSTYGNGSTERASLGYMKSSPDGQRIAVAINDQRTFEIFDFDKKSGKLSNTIQLKDNKFYLAYGVEFSPDSKLLYMSGVQTKARIYQAALVSMNASEIMNTLVEVGRSDSNDFGALQLAPDGRIYIAQDSSLSLSVIENPDQRGIRCNYKENAVKLIKPSGLGLPNLIPSLLAKPLIARISQKPAACGTTTLEATTTSQESVNYQWYFNNNVLPTATTSSIIGTKTGIYTVRIAQNKACDTLLAYDSINLLVTPEKIIKPTITASGTTTICRGNSVSLITSSQDSVVHDWYNGQRKIATNIRGITVTEAGTYTVKAYTQCDSIRSDTVLITVSTKPVNPLGPDTVFCAGKKLVLKPVQTDWKITWDDKSTTVERSVSQPGLYWATIEANGCTVIDTIHIKEKPIHTFNLGDDISLCYGRSAVLHSPPDKPVDGRYNWFDGSQADSLVIDKAGHVWLESDLAGCMYRDSVDVSLKFCVSTAYIPDAFTPNNDATNDLFIPKFSPEALITAYSFTIYSRWGNVLFSTNELQNGWNGNYRNEPCLPGEYAYRITFSYLENSVTKRVEKQGTVLLIR